MIQIKQKGDFKKLDKFFKKSVKLTKFDDINALAEKCIEDLKAVTPKDSGLTANSWTYSIVKGKNYNTLHIYNTNIQNGAKIALLLEFGHVSRDGGWIEGKNFIDPTIREAYNQVLNKTWKELRKL